jgi:hypothetical protein
VNAMRAAPLRIGFCWGRCNRRFRFAHRDVFLLRKVRATSLTRAKVYRLKGRRERRPQPGLR